MKNSEKSITIKLKADTKEFMCDLNIAESVTKIDVIARDEKLKLIFDGVVKKYQAKYA